MESETNNNEPVGSVEAGESTVNCQSNTDNSEHRTFAVLGYILPFLFFLPLLNNKNKNIPYVRFHANQQLVLLIFVIALNFLSNFLYMTFLSVGMMISQAISLVIFAFAIFGAWNAYNGNSKELPFIGHFRILK